MGLRVNDFGRSFWYMDVIFVVKTILGLIIEP
jgi:hypothetical protein